MRHSTYALSACTEIISRYVKLDGDVTTLEEGVLGLGTVICTGIGLKTTIIQEIPLNEWSSTHTIRMYNRIPKKYLALLLQESSETL
jgi:hypothetical protein